MAMRWRWPPENSCGCFRASEALRPTASSEARDARAALGPARSAQRRQRFGDDFSDSLARVERTVRVLEDHLHMRPHRAQLAARQFEQRAPLEAHRAESGRSSASAMRARVDFPEPDSPTIPNERPCRTEKLTPASAGRALLRGERASARQAIGLDER